MTHFHHLRTTPWEPSFEWVTTMAEAADRINVWHEDYPRRVLGTRVLIQRLSGVGLDFPKPLLRRRRGRPEVRTSLNGRGIVRPQIIFNHTLRTLHSVLFNELESHGAWRPVRVRVGPHYPPSPGEVPRLMEKLEDHYLLKVRNVD